MGSQQRGQRLFGDVSVVQLTRRVDQQGRRPRQLLFHQQFIPLRQFGEIQPGHQIQQVRLFVALLQRFAAQPLLQQLQATAEPRIGCIASRPVLFVQPSHLGLVDRREAVQQALHVFHNLLVVGHNIPCETDLSILTHQLLRSAAIKEFRQLRRLSSRVSSRRCFAEPRLLGIYRRHDCLQPQICLDSLESPNVVRPVASQSAFGDFLVLFDDVSSPFFLSFTCLASYSILFSSPSRSLTA